MPVHAAEEDLDFAFIKNPPGKLVLIDNYRLHVNCIGQGEITVLFEAGLGGSSLEWTPIQEKLQSRAVACFYDRAGYAWSDPSPYPRSARQCAHEANQLLDAMDIRGPIILVGHSFGGFVIRLLAKLRQDDVVGMVLVDASHEDQLKKFELLGGASAMPKTNNFVLSATEVPENLPRDLARKISALGRMRKTYNATHGEMSQFRLSGRQVRAQRRQVDFPLIVMRRGQDPYSNDRIGAQKAVIWNELQHDLTTLSTQGSMMIGNDSGHHIHIDEPALVVNAIESLIDKYEKEIR